MGTPTTKHSMHDALGDLGSMIVPNHIKHFFNTTATILDVGAGWGKYAKLLPEFKNIDAVEIWNPYVEENDLEALYRQVFRLDVCDLHDINYDIIILGDVLEHIDRGRAVELIERLKKSCIQLYIVVPYEYHQDEVNGNKYEIHLQEDLTDDLIKELYGLKLFARDDIKGVYIK